jgi:CRP-like cAMP-binding protein
MQDLLEFVKQFPLSTFEKKQTILSPGEAINSIYIIISGFAKVSIIDRLGNEQVLWIAGRSDIVPTELFFQKTVKPAFLYSSLSQVKAYKVGKADFLSYAETAPMVMREIAYGMSNHYDDLMHRLSSITQASAREKLVYVLYNMAVRFSASDKVDLLELGLVLTHQDFASLIHATRETASIELKKLKDEGYIEYGDGRFVINTSRLGLLLA